MAINFKYLAVFLSLPLIACNQTEERHKENGALLFKPLPTFASSAIGTYSIFGTWKYEFPFYSSELVINRDSTFQYTSKGCTQKQYTAGKWAQNGPYIFLKSYDAYNRNKVKQIEINFNSKTTKRKGKPGSLIYLINPEVVAETIAFSPNDTTKIYFEKLALRIEYDTLFELDKEYLKTSVKYTSKLAGSVYDVLQ